MNRNFYKFVFGKINTPPSLTSEQITAIAGQINLSEYVRTETGKSLVLNTEISKIHSPGSDNQDLSGLATVSALENHGHSISAVTGLSTALTNKEPANSNIQIHVTSQHAPSNANYYEHPTSHEPSIINQDTGNRFVSDTEKGLWNGKEAGGAVSSHESSYAHADYNIAYSHSQATHAPTNAQKNSDITKEEIEAKLTGSILTHSHAGGANPFTFVLTVSGDKATGANTTPINLGISFPYEANSKYIIDIYAMVAPTAAGTGCGFPIDVSSAVTYVGSFVAHQLAITGTLSGAGSVGDLGVTSSGVSSGMVLAASAGSNFVYGGGILITGANAGTATFYFRSETTAVTTCKGNSIIRIMKA